MGKPKTFITDAQWQRKQHAMLLERAEDPQTAKRLVEKLDQDPELRQGLWDIYVRAMRTLDETKD